MEMSPPHLAGQKREPQDRLAGVSPQSVYMAGKGGQGMVKICREAAYLNNRLQPTSLPPRLRRYGKAAAEPGR
jgi:hypothetical protein